MLDSTHTGLDKIQIAALRKADRVSFHRLATGESFIRATKDIKASTAEPFAHAVDVQIPCESYLRDWGKPRLGDDKWTAFEYCYSAQYDDEWQTIASLLKPGDSLALNWERGGLTNQSLEERDIVADKLSLRVVRPDAKRALTFFVGAQAGPDNSARMIRRA